MSTDPRTEHAGIWKEFLDNGGELPAVNLFASPCETCSGHGVVGRMTFEGGDYDDCPDCKGTGNTITKEAQDD